MAKKKKGTKRRTNNATKRVAQDLRRFKGQLKRFIDATKIEWEGAPYAQGSIYKFVLDDRLTGFIMTLRDRAQQTKEAQAKRATMEMAENIRLATQAAPEGDEPSEPDEESEAAFEKFLTVSDSEGIIDCDAEETEETEAAEGEVVTNVPGSPPGDAEGSGGLGHSDAAEGDA